MASDGTYGTSAGRGRPSRPADATIANGLVYLRMRNAGASPDSIAASEGVARSTVYNAIKLAESRSDTEAPATAALADWQAEPQSPRRLSLSAVLRRLWVHVMHCPTMTLGVAENNFWMRLVVAIHQDGDGSRLGIGTPGGRYATRSELASLVYAEHFHAGDAIDVDGWLSKLFARGRLLDLDGGDIGIPAGLGLVRGENARGQPVRRRAMSRPPEALSRPLPFGLQLVKGDRAADQDGANLSGENPADPSGNIRIYPDKPVNFSGLEGGGLSEENRLARSVDVDVIVKENKDININNNPFSRTDESGNNPSGLSGNNPPDDAAGEAKESGSGRESGTASPRSEAAMLAGELVVLANLKRQPVGRELGLVENWLRITAENKLSDAGRLMKDVIRNAMERIAAKRLDPANSLNYFDREMMDAFANAVRPPSAPGLGSKRAEVKAAKAALSEDDQALKVLLDTAWENWRNDPGRHPMPASLSARDAAIARGQSELAARWIEAFKLWKAAGMPSDYKPPDFSEQTLASAEFDRRLTQCEEGLTSPATGDG